MSPVGTSPTQLGNLMLRDEQISIEARGSLAFILSFPTDWRFDMARFMRGTQSGRDRAYRILRELEEHGYCRRSQIRNDDGTIGTIEYLFTDEAHNLDAPCPENTDTVCEPLPEKPDTENPTHTKKSQSKKKKVKKLDASLTDAAPVERLPFTADVIAELRRLDVELEPLIARYVKRTKGRSIRDPSAYLLRMGHDEVAKRCGVAVETVKASTSLNLALRMAASAVFIPNSDIVARERRFRGDDVVDAALRALAERRFSTQAAANRAFEGTVGNLHFRRRAA